jgi:hypothetical protein
VRRPELEPLGQLVDEEGLGAALLDHERDRLTDRAGAEDHHAFFFRDAGALDGLDGDRGRLGERRAQRALVADGEHLCGRDAEELLQAAVAVDADQREVRAHVGAPDPARIAMPARLKRPDGDALAGLKEIRRVGAERLDHPGDLVTLNARELGAVHVGDDDLAGQEVEVRPAQADRLRADNGPDRAPVRPAPAGR